MKPSNRYQKGRGKNLKPLCPSCGTYLVRQSVKLGPSGSQKWYKTSWICPECYHMELDKDAVKEFQEKTESKNYEKST